MLTMMFSPELKEDFTAFLRAKYADENMLFVDECARFAEAAFETPQDLRADAKRIYDTYVREGAPLELNIGYEQRRPLEEAILTAAPAPAPQTPITTTSSSLPSTSSSSSASPSPLLAPAAAAAAPAPPISQAIFEDLCLEIRNFMEVAFLPAWVAAGSWRGIPHKHYAPNLPSLKQVLRSRRMLNQLLLYVSSHGGKEVAEALAACEEFERKHSLEAFIRVMGLSQEVLGGGGIEGEEEGSNFGQMKSLGDMSVEKCNEMAGLVRKRVIKVLETRFFLDWVVRKTWTSVYIPQVRKEQQKVGDDDSEKKDGKEVDKKDGDIKEDKEKEETKEEESDHN